MSLRDLILKNLGLKIFSLVLAALVWFAIQANPHSDGRAPINPFRTVATRDFLRPVTVINAGDPPAPFTVEPNEVTVRVSGEAAVLRQLFAEEIQVYVNASDKADGQGLRRLEVKPPPEAGLQQVWPERVRVTAARPN